MLAVFQLQFLLIGFTIAKCICQDEAEISKRCENDDQKLQLLKEQEPLSPVLLHKNYVEGFLKRVQENAAQVKCSHFPYLENFQTLLFERRSNLKLS